MISDLLPLNAFFDFLNWAMWPLYAAVSGILVGAYHLWAPVTGTDSGWTWVLSIISLTVVIRTLLIPLFVRQIESARNMQLIQPKVKALQEKYGADRERLGQETMKLYKEEGVNPAASCLPLLLQMPIFLALFNVLSGVARGNINGYFFEREPDLVHSLSSSDIFGARLAGTFFPIENFGATQILALVLILSMTAVLFITQLQLMQKNMTPEALTGPFAQQQKMMLYVFPIMYMVGGVSIPIGVLIYWLTSNIWTLAQQYWLIRRNPSPNTPAYLDWEERMIARGKDPKKIQAERMAKQRKKPASYEQPSSTPSTVSDGDAPATAKTGAPAVQRQQIQRQQPRRSGRAERKKGGATAASSQDPSAPAGS